MGFVREEERARAAERTATAAAAVTAKGTDNISDNFNSTDC